MGDGGRGGHLIVLPLMARSHCTEPGTGAGPGMGTGTMGYYNCTVLFTLV